MDINQYRDIITSSTPQQWVRIACWGMGSGPSFRGEIQEVDKNGQIISKRYSDIATYKPNLAIGIAWGYPHLDDGEFQEEWHQRLPDPKASADIIDFYFQGNVVHREIYVSIDGGRVKVPMPAPDTLEVSRIQLDFYRVLNAIESSVDFDRYIRNLGFVSADKSWF